MTALADEIKVRHYSPKTLKSYRAWVSKFQVFTRSKDPEWLDSEEGDKTQIIAFYVVVIIS